jgi:hypothetical protein
MRRSRLDGTSGGDGCPTHRQSRSSELFFVLLFIVRDKVFFAGIDDKDGE